MAVITGTNLGDVLTGFSSDDEYFGLDGNDRIVGSAGQDTLWGGNGQDTVDYSVAASVQTDLSGQVTFPNTDGQGSYDYLFSIEHVIGSTFGDRIA